MLQPTVDRSAVYGHSVPTPEEAHPDVQNEVWI